MPKICSVTKHLRIVPGTLDDYNRLAHYHYRSGSLGPLAGIFVLKPASTSPTDVVGVIVYKMPCVGAELRNAATGNFFAGLDRSTQLTLINKNIRCISRVIIEPRFRGLGLAVRLVSETMPRLNVPIIEAMAVMGMVNPFFEKAGMKAYEAPLPQRCAEFVEALSVVGIEQSEIVDAEMVQRKLDALRWPAADFIEGRIRKFLQSYGKRRNMTPGIERTRYILSKLTARPIYYIWFNQNLVFSPAFHAGLNYRASSIKTMTSEIKQIAIEKLIPHPDNPNRMSKANFDKLVRNIERSGRYEPLVVRPCPDARGTRVDGRLSASPCPESQCASVFQIINGHHRWQALKQLGYKSADVVIWDIDDHQTDILLATLNRLGGSDSIEKKLALLKRLNKQLAARELAKLLPATSKQIERLANLKPPTAPATPANCFANPLVFFVNDTQQQIIEQAMSLATRNQNEKTKAAKRAAALTTIALGWLESKPATRRNQL